MATASKSLYANLKKRIVGFFLSHENQEVEIGLADNCNADFGSRDGKIIGEIKSKCDLAGSCKSAWGHWRNASGMRQLKCVKNLSKEIVDVFPAAKEKIIVAIILGQLQTYVCHAWLKRGWLVLEDPEGEWWTIVQDTIRKMKAYNLIKEGQIERCDGLVFCKIEYFSFCCLFE